MKAKKITSRNLRRNIEVGKVLQLIPEALITQLADELDVDYQVKKLWAKLIFQLLLYVIIDSERLSLRVLEEYYNSIDFSVLSKKGGHKTRHSSIAARLTNIKSEYFEKIYLAVLADADKKYNTNPTIQNLKRFDSTLVAIGSKLIDFGMEVGAKNKKGNGKKQIKYTIGLKGLFPSDIKLYTAQKELSEEIALKNTINASACDSECIITFDRGLKKRDTFEDFENEGKSFVVRGQLPIRYEQIAVYKEIKNRENETLIFEKDIIVKLYSSGNVLTTNTFRLILATSKATKKQIAFITNIADMTAMEISEIYRLRWDIEVFFRFLKQELNLKHLASFSTNGLKVMMYMIMISAILLIVYKKLNKLTGYKIPKLRFKMELKNEINFLLAQINGADPKKIKYYKSRPWKLYAELNSL